MLSAPRVIALSIFLVIALAAFAKEPPLASESELAAISARGRLLYEYDQAAWRAGDALEATHPQKEKLGRYVAQKTDSGWVIAFGHLNETKDAFLVGAIAAQGKTLQDFSVKTLNSPQADTGFYLFAARALETTLPAFQTGVNRPYNAAVLPAPAGQFYVYLVPAQIDDDGDYFPLGADVRYIVSADGNSITETRQLHKSLIPKAQILPGTQLAAGFHSHVLSDIPEDTDVFCVLSRKPALPEYVGTQVAVYVVNTDGSIHFVERTKKR